MLEKVSEVCSDIVQVTQDYPEITVAAWGLSIVMTLVQLTLLGKKLLSRRRYVKDNDEDVEYRDVPYVPNDLLVKVVNLLRSENVNWLAQQDKLTTGNIVLKRGSFGVEVYSQDAFCNLVNIGANKITTTSNEYRLLKDEFDLRYNREMNAIAEIRRKEQEEKQKRAELDLTQALDACLKPVRKLNVPF